MQTPEIVTKPELTVIGLRAAFIRRGPIRKIGETLEEIYRGWLRDSGHVHSGIADVEVYDEHFCPDSEDSEMEYWVSVVPVDAR